MVIGLELPPTTGSFFACKSAQEAGLRSTAIPRAIGSRSEYPVTKALRVAGLYSSSDIGGCHGAVV